MSTKSHSKSAPTSKPIATAGIVSGTARTAWLQSIGYYAAFIAIGLNAAILGPTLDHLADHTGSMLSYPNCPSG